MKRLSWVLAVLAIGIVGLGFYRGWFVLSGGHENASNKVDVNLSMDPDKVKEDAETVSKKVHSLTDPSQK